MRKAYKFRLYPTKKQEKVLFWTLTRCRELYNAGATSTYLLTLSEATNKEVCW
jgi:transposase